jgi:hypothetical protein
MQRWLLDEGSEARGLRVVTRGAARLPEEEREEHRRVGLALYLLTSGRRGGPGGLRARVVEGSGADRLQRRPHDGREVAAGCSRSSQIGRGHTTTSIFHPASDGVFKAISADSDLQEGLNPSGGVADEIHTYPTRALYDNVRAAMISREQPLLVGLTTAGVTFKAKGGRELNLLGDLYQRGAGRRPKYRLGSCTRRSPSTATRRALARRAAPRQGRRFYFKWFEVPWRHRENLRYWLAANPIAYMTEEKLQDEADVERPRGIFYRYHCNITTASRSTGSRRQAREDARAEARRLERDEQVDRDRRRRPELRHDRDLA